MPTYEYKCFACDHAFEQFQSIMAKPIKRCPECGKLKVKRLLGTGGGLIFKGSGFYITDYRSTGYKDAAKADTGSAGKTDKASGDSPASGESKSAPKSDKASTPRTESKPAAKKDKS